MPCLFLEHMGGHTKLSNPATSRDGADIGWLHQIKAPGMPVPGPTPCLRARFDAFCPHFQSALKATSASSTAPGVYQRFPLRYNADKSGEFPDRGMWGEVTPLSRGAVSNGPTAVVLSPTWTSNEFWFTRIAISALRNVHVPNNLESRPFPLLPFLFPRVT